MIYKCYVCFESFEKSSDLVEHLKTFHGLKDGCKFSCEFQDCGRSYQTVNSFRKHLNSAHPKTEITEQSKIKNVLNNQKKDIPQEFFDIKDEFYDKRPQVIQEMKKVVTDYVVDIYTKNMTREDINFSIRSYDIMSITVEYFAKIDVINF